MSDEPDSALREAGRQQLAGQLASDGWYRVGRIGVAVFVTWAGILPIVGLLLLAIAGFTSRLLNADGAALFAAGITALGISPVIGVFYHRWLRAAGGGTPQHLAEILAFLVLPIWGLCYSHTAQVDCITTTCGGPDVWRPLAEPDMLALVGLHTVSVAAYWVSRRRPEALAPVVEALLGGSLIVGVAVQLALAIHFGTWVGLGLLFPPLFAPCIAPLVTPLFYLGELRTRLYWRGVDAALAGFPPALPHYRVTGMPEVPRLRMHGPSVRRALLASPVLLGLYAVAQALWKGHPAGALDVFTQTCGYTFSRVPIEVVPADCHYLCTVAARGHAWLVRPMRVGRRRGRRILVNRQLATANAFEDLLHERWPRFGNWARRTYDRCGPNLCRWIRSRWASDAVFLLMKPLEWGFYAALVLLDPHPPEQRIDRMYR